MDDLSWCDKPGQDFKYVSFTTDALQGVPEIIIIMLL